MRIGVTVNLGNYESLRIDTSDLPNIKMCLQELDYALRQFDSGAVIKFRERYIASALDKPQNR